EVEIPAIGVECRKGSIAHAVCDLMSSLSFKPIDENRTHAADELAGIGKPSTIGRPHGIESRPWTVFIWVAIHQDGLASVDIHILEMQPFIAVHDLLTIGRPGGRVIKAWRSTEIYFSCITEPILRAQVQRVLTRLVGKVGDPFAVGRPGGIAVGDGG